MRVYIAGPMTGITDYNRPAFAAAASCLHARGYEVINPGDNTVESDEWSDYLRKGISQLVTCDAIYLLPGWGNSRGAYLEFLIATALEMAVVAL